MKGQLAYQLPRFDSLATALAWAMPQFEADAVPGDVTFVQMDFGPVAIHRDGTVREAELVPLNNGYSMLVEKVC